MDYALALERRIVAVANVAIYPLFLYKASGFQRRGYDILSTCLRNFDSSKDGVKPSGHLGARSVSGVIFGPDFMTAWDYPK